MRALLRAAGQAAIALGFFSLGADLYWTWAAHDWAYRPIGFYLDLIDPRWGFSFRTWAMGWSVQAAEAASRFLTWPVWVPAFGLGLVLALISNSSDRRPR